MNFLLSALDGQNDGDEGFGDDGGWGSEEDIDLSDDDYDTETTGYDTEATPQVQQQPQGYQAPPPPANNDGIRIGGGMFMGRLAQFMDTVAPPAQNEDVGISDGWADDDIDVDAGGWGDDDDALGNLDDSADATEYVANDTSAISTQAVVAPAAVPPPPPPPPPPPADAESLASSAAVGMASTTGMNQTIDTKVNDTTPDDDDDDNGAGWGNDDDDLLFDDEDNNDVVNVENAIEADITFETAPTQSIPPPPPPAIPDDDGWDNDEDGFLFDDGYVQNVPDVGDVDETIAAEKPEESLQLPPPPPPPPQIPIPTEDTNDGGWDDDDELEFDDDEDVGDVAEAGISMIVKSVESQSTSTEPPSAIPDISFGADTIQTNDAVGVASTGDITKEIDVENDDDLDDASGWGADDDLLDDAVETDMKLESTKPPHPPVQTAISDDEDLVNDDDGWGDDDDLGINMSEDFDDNNAVQDGKNVVDHIPSPTPPMNFGDPSNGLEDDISRDDTLSIDNSRSQQNATSGGLRTSLLGDEDSESAADFSNTEPEVEFKQNEVAMRTIPIFGSASGRLGSRRVVDFTPRRTRISGNDSMLVSGHTSVGESLDSIDEANEEDYEDELDLDNAQNLRKLSGVTIPESSSQQDESVTTPRTMESGWGALRQQSQSTQLKSEQASSEIPFGSASTPTAGNNNPTPRRFVALNDTGSPVVDHTPGINEDSNTNFHGRLSVATSVDVLGGLSEGDLGEDDTAGVDDIKDELYGPMVDQLPSSRRENSPTRRQRKFSLEVASVGSTVVGQAENKDIQEDIHNDDAMDEEEEGVEDGVDESSKGWGSILEFDNRSLLSGLPLPVVDETQYLVDHVPVGKLLRGGAASTMAMMDASMASSRADDNVDGSNNVNFGRIVDHTPSLAVPSRGAPSIATSVATAVSGLDGDIKEDDDMDHTTVAGGTVDSGDAREDQNIDKVENVEDDHIVDHVPEGKVRPVNPDASVRVLVGKDDDMTQVDTIAEDVAMEFGPIVDQTPLPFSRNTSGGQSVEGSFLAQRNAIDDNNTATIGTVTEADDNSGWDHDEPDLDDLSAGAQAVTLTDSSKEESNLVDHIPSRSFAKPVDGSTIVLVDPVDAASEVDDADDDTAGNARVDKFGPVVDHTPAPRSAPLSLATSMVNQANDGAASDNRHDADIDGSATWFGASTLGGISSASGDNDSETGWDEDDLGDLASPVVPRPVQTPVNDHLVDHIPSLASPRNEDANASTAVAIDPSVISNQTQEDKMGGGLFGAVVDHTPSVGPITQHSADNSTMVTGFATNTKRDVEMDETTWQGGVSAQGEGWEQDDPELEELANNTDDNSPHLVDHVPERPESRYGDPSLIVAANPSDMSSQVEDLNQDENHFGPVVDQTPLERVLPPPAVGSTVVALPSVLNDVSDEGDNDGSNVEGARVPNEWEEQIPNPQSGIDADITREQLVDVVPPPPLPEQQPIVRDASSEMAILDDKSTQVPADEPKEDEFGPVVDHTPMGEPADGSEGRRRGPSHHEHSDGDKKPAATMDSVAPNYSVESKEKEDELDEDEFGPVVDQLPVSCSKSSLAPSKGGSTVDALATVSEGEDDLNTRDGWDDDTLDLIDQVSPTNMSHRGSHSVTWDENVFNGKEGDSKGVDTSKQSTDVGDSTFFTAAESNLSSQVGLDETKFYDPEESSDTNGWGNDSLNIADDDTPPSTPRASGIFKKKPVVDSGSVGAIGYQALLGTRGDNESMAGDINTNDGDLRKLLEEEMAKTLLLEKESDALRKMVDSLKKAKEQLLTLAKQHVDQEDELMNSISKWQEANVNLSSENAKLSEDLLKSREESNKLIGDVSSYQNENRKLSSENGELSGEISKLQNDNSDLSLENKRLSLNNCKFSENIQKIEGECADLRGRNDLLSNELGKLRKSVSQLEEEKSEILAKEATNTAEIVNLKTSLEKQLQNATSDASLREELRFAQTELSAKVNECSQLSVKLIVVEEKLRKSDAQNFKHAKDLARMTKDHMQKVSDLQKQIESRQHNLEDTRLLNKNAIADLERRLASEAAANQKLEQENGVLVKQNNDLQLHLETAESEKLQELSHKDSDMQALNAKLKCAEENSACLTNQVNDYAQQLERFASISAEFDSMKKERDVLKEELIDYKTHLAAMHQHFDAFNSALGFTCSKPELLLKAIQNERANQLQEIVSSQNEISQLASRLDAIQSEKNSIQAQFETYRKSQESSQNASAVSALNAIKEEGKLSKIQGEVNRLRAQLLRSQNDLQSSESENNRLSHTVAALQNEISELRDIAAQHCRLQEDLSQSQIVNKSKGQRIEVLEANIVESQTKLSSKDKEIAVLREQLASLQSDRMGIEHEKKQLLTRLEETNSRIVDLESGRDKYENEMNARIAKLGSGRDAYAEEMKARMHELNSDRDALAAENKDLIGQLHEMNEELRLLVNERDTLLGEKEVLESDNEEALVQLGILSNKLQAKESEQAYVEEELLRLENERETYEKALEDSRNEGTAYKEQLEVQRRMYEEQLFAKDAQKTSEERELKNHLQITHRRTQEYGNQLHMSEEKLDVLIRESEEAANNVGSVDGKTKKLIDVNTALLAKIQTMASEQTAAAENVQALESHKLSLTRKTVDLQKLVDELIASFGDEERKNQSILEHVKQEKEEISNKSLHQESEIIRLRQELETSKSAVEECAVLRRNLADAENKLSEYDRLVQQKDAAAKDLYNQLQNAGNAPVESAEVEMLRDSVRELEANKSSDKHKIHELGEICDQTQQDLFRRTEELQFSSERVQQLESDLKSKQDVESTNEMLESRVYQLENELMNEKKYRKEQFAAQQPSNDKNVEMLDELLILRRQVASLQQQKKESSVRSGREEAIEHELRLLQEQMAQKDIQIASMDEKMQCIDINLTESKQQADEKQANIDELTAELERMKLVASDNSMSKILEENHEMSNQLVQLAKAFAKSETTRANILEGVENERRVQANRVEQYAVNLKRFYATLKMSNT